MPQLESSAKEVDTFRIQPALLSEDTGRRKLDSLPERNLNGLQFKSQSPDPPRNVLNGAPTVDVSLGIPTRMAQ